MLTVDFIRPLLTLPRCMRHFEIYQQPWPVRTPPPGTALPFVPTPRELTPADHASKSSKKVLKYLKRQAEEANASRKRPHEETVDENPRPSKKAKGQDRVIVKVKSVASPAKAPPQAATEEPPVKRKRGRPRLSSPRCKSNKVEVTKPEVTVKVEEEENMSLAKRPFTQPRGQNGRFGRKDKNRKTSDNGPASPLKSPKSRPEKNAQNIDNSKGSWSSPRRKRPSSEGPEDMEDSSPRKRRTGVEIIDVDSPRHNQKVLPRRSNFKGGSLLSNPNPLRFALHAWAGPVVLDDSSSEEDSSVPDTPEDSIPSPPVEIVSVDEDPDEFSASALVPAPPTVHRAPLIYKPSPTALSKRRWVALSKLPERIERITTSGDPQSPRSEDTPDDDHDDDALQGDLPSHPKPATLKSAGSYTSRWTTRASLAAEDVSRLSLDLPWNKIIDSDSSPLDDRVSLGITSPLLTNSTP